MNGCESFTKLHFRKCLIGRIEINKEVNNDLRSCKKRVSLNKFINYCAYIRTFGQMLVRKFCQVLLFIDQSIFAAEYPNF